MPPSLPELTLRPIGVVRSPLTDRVSAPRQSAASGVAGTIELFPQSGIEHALEDLDGFRVIWVLFWFHLNADWRPKVRPPRSRARRGVFATRSPYRPNPLGMSAVELARIDGLVLHVGNLDMLDGTPVLDLKPYVPYTDAIPEATSGWLEAAERPRDPGPSYAVDFAPLASEQLAFLEALGVALREPVAQALALGPAPHPYRRIKQTQAGLVLAHRAWRLSFETHGERVLVTAVHSGHRPSEVFRSDAPELAAHRAFLERFGV